MFSWGILLWKKHVLFSQLAIPARSKKVNPLIAMVMPIFKLQKVEFLGRYPIHLATCHHLYTPSLGITPLLTPP